MHELVRGKLAELIARFGADLCDDPKRCEGLLRDVCGQHRREIFVLVSAAREGVGTELRRSAAGTPTEVVVGRLSKRLHENLGLAEELARWAVESWAFALGAVGPAPPRPSRPAGASGTVSARGSSQTTIGSSSAEEDDLFAEFPRVPSEEILRQAIRGVLADGIVTDVERAEIQKLRKDLGIAPDVAARLLAEVKAELEAQRGKASPGPARKPSPAPPGPPPRPPVTGVLSEAVVLGILRSVGAVDGLYVAPSIPPKKARNAQASCQIPADEQMLGLIDATVFGSAKNSMVIGTRAVYYHNDWAGKQTGTAKVAYADFPKRIFVHSGYEIGLGGADSFNIAGSSVKAPVVLGILNALKEAAKNP